MYARLSDAQQLHFLVPILRLRAQHLGHDELSLQKRVLLPSPLELHTTQTGRTRSHGALPAVVCCSTRVSVVSTGVGAGIEKVVVPRPTSALHASTGVRVETGVAGGVVLCAAAAVRRLCAIDAKRVLCHKNPKSE